jgi:hypothetical protein
MAHRGEARGKLSREEVRELLDTERGRILRRLKQVADREERERKKYAARRRRAKAQIASLLREGRELGIPVVELARTIVVTRQMAHRLIKDAEEQKRDEKEGRNA